jgi:hypothetical protein
LSTVHGVLLPYGLPQLSQLLPKVNAHLAQCGFVLVGLSPGPVVS